MYRAVNPSIWRNAKFHPLAHDEKLAFLYVLTHPFLTRIGTVYAFADEFAATLNVSRDDVFPMISRLDALGLIASDLADGVIAVPNYLKHNPIVTAKQVTLAHSQLQPLPECPVYSDQIRRFLDHVEQQSPKIRRAAAHYFPELKTESATRTHTHTRTHASTRAFGAGVGCSDSSSGSSSNNSSSISFEDFWKAYPRKQQQTKAAQAWNKLDPDTDTAVTILDAVKAWKRSKQWQSERGRYVPLPHNFLLNRIWEDEPGPPDNIAESNKTDEDLNDDRATF
ncbi:MAG TPA: hypothetical protein PKI11_21495 [Candidatus Hydrogenedentes bacterium]|nr:hypothetical protein [Candidatus Hydrogenedentota bacterium]